MTKTPNVQKKWNTFKFWNVQTIIVGGKEGGIAFLNSEDYKISTLLKFSSLVKCLCLSPNEEVLAAGSVDGSIRIISVSQSIIFVTLRNEHPRPSGKKTRPILMKLSIFFYRIFPKCHIFKRLHLYV